MIDIFSEHLIRLRDVPSHLPRRGSKKLHYSTVYRWAIDGVNGPDSRIFLETAKTGGSVYTSLEALERFTLKQTHSNELPPGKEESRSADRHPRSQHTSDSLSRMVNWKPGDEDGEAR